MTEHECKTVTVDYPKGRWGWTRRPLPDFDPVVNREARDGWRLKQVLQPAEGFGYTAAFVLVLEREAGT